MKWRQTVGLRLFWVDCRNTLGPVIQCSLVPVLPHCHVSLVVDLPSLQNVDAAVAVGVGTVILLDRCEKIYKKMR